MNLSPPHPWNNFEAPLMLRVSFSMRFDPVDDPLGFRLAPQGVKVARIQAVLCEHFELSRTDLLSERRARAVARPRQIGMWLCKKLTTRSLPDIGARFGGRDHTTVIHAVRRIEALVREDPAIKRHVQALLEKLSQSPTDVPQ